MRTMPRLRLLHPTATNSSHFSPLRSRQHIALLTSLDATLMDCRARVANTRLTEKLNPLDATLTKNQGWGVSFPIWKGLHESAMRTRLLTQALSFHTLAHSFALAKNSTLFFSCASALFAQNHRGWGIPVTLTSHHNLLFPLVRPTMNTASHLARSRHA